MYLKIFLLLFSIKKKLLQYQCLCSFSAYNDSISSFDFLSVLQLGFENSVIATIYHKFHR